MSAPSSPSCSTPVTSTRSLSRSTGPRSLHLVVNNVSVQDHSSTSPLSSSLRISSPCSSTSTPPPSATKTNGFHPARRQSSISYKSKDDVNLRPGLSRSLSVGLKSPISHAHGLAVPDRPLSTTRSVTPERPPLTLAEKHAELLQFIAQKESKCLELRSQLAIHEAELLQLKRKWERIASRKFDRVNGVNDMTSTSSIGTVQGGAMLEGIKESVQGVSRLISAGLGEFSASSQHQASVPQPRHSLRLSNSSISTSTTNSTRYSQSSASSLGDEPPSQEQGQVLMVHDTGATPTMSPNPAFMHQQQQEKEREDRARSSFENETGCFATEQSRTPISPLPSPAGPLTSARSLSLEARRVSSNGSPFSPTSSIPVIGSLAAVGTNAPPVSSWIGSVGKKWEELQRGSTFTKGQKKASILLSDVSQTIVSALSPAAALSPESWPQKDNEHSPQFKSPLSLLDEDDGCDISIGSVMTPDSPKPSPPPQQDDEDEWNW